MAAKKPKPSARESKAKTVPVPDHSVKDNVPLKERAVLAALELSTSLGWDMVTLSDIASETGSSLSELREIFEDKTDILCSYGRMLDRDVLKAAGLPDAGSPERERLFEILMERFDLLNRDRAAVLSILKSFGTDPVQAVISLPHLGRSMAWMLEAAGIDIKGVRGAARIAGVTGVYLATLRAWMRDETEDLSGTMATLDKCLNRAEKIAEMLRL